VESDTKASFNFNNEDVQNDIRTSTYNIIKILLQILPVEPNERIKKLNEDFPQWRAILALNQIKPTQVLNSPPISPPLIPSAGGGLTKHMAQKKSQAHGPKPSSELPTSPSHG
jgi:hypothetical protein